jgi:hypothetical protein
VSLVIQIIVSDLLFSPGHLVKLLEQLEDTMTTDAATIPEGINVWKAQRLSRASKLGEFMRKPFRTRNLWISVQCVFKASDFQVALAG